MRVVIAVGAVAVLILGGFTFVAMRPGAPPVLVAPSTPPQASASDRASAPPGSTARVETFDQGHDAPPPGAFERADEATVRLSPDDFPDLPAPIAFDLKRRGCTIPQTYSAERLQNVIRGRFLSAVSFDWAVLCSRNRVSAILVFSNGSADAVVEMGESPDSGWLQGGAREIGFSRAIGVASPEQILEHHKDHGGTKPPPLDHDGIEEAFLEKASGVHYWYGDRWLSLSGAD